MLCFEFLDSRGSSSPSLKFLWSSKSLGCTSGAATCMWKSCAKTCISGKKCLFLQRLVSAMELAGEPQGRFKGSDHRSCATKGRNTTSSLGVVNNKERNYSFLLCWSRWSVCVGFVLYGSSWCFHIQLKKAFTEQALLSRNPPGKMEAGFWTPFIWMAFVLSGTGTIQVTQGFCT